MKLKNGITAAIGMFVTDGKSISGRLVEIGQTEGTPVGKVLEFGPAGGHIPVKIEQWDEWGEGRQKLGYVFHHARLADLLPLVPAPAQATHDPTRFEQPAPAPPVDPLHAAS